MLDKHMPLIEEAARRGVHVLCLQELFNGPYFCAEQQPRWYDYALRALMVAVLVGIVVTFSFRIGSYGSGLLAVFPVVLTSIILVLHRRAGGKPTAAVLANAPLGLLGFGIACMVLHLTAEPLGVVAGLSLALATSIGWNLAVLVAQRRGVAV